MILAPGLWSVEIANAMLVQLLDRVTLNQRGESVESSSADRPQEPIAAQFTPLRNQEFRLGQFPGFATKDEEL